MAQLNDLERRAIQQLTRTLGSQQAEKVFREALARSGRSQVGSHQDMLAVADCLITSGGAAAMVGRSLRVHASLHGAKG